MIFCDVDGVLNCWGDHAARTHGKPVPYMGKHWEMRLEYGMSKEEFEAPFDRDWWLSVPVHPHAQQMFEILEGTGQDFAFLSAPMQHESWAWKSEWFDKHFPQHHKRLIITHDKTVLARKNILIDDRNENVEDFWLAGGKGILVPRPWNKLNHYGPWHIRPKTTLETVENTLRSMLGLSCEPEYQQVPYPVWLRIVFERFDIEQRAQIENIERHLANYERLKNAAIRNPV